MSDRTGAAGFRTLCGRVAAAVLCLVIAGAARAADYNQIEQLQQTGQYEEAHRQATAALAEGNYGERWPLIQAELAFTLGRYDEAADTIREALKKYPWSIQLRRLGHHAFRFADDSQTADAMLPQILSAVRNSPWRYSDAQNLVTLGQTALALGADPKQVLESFYDRAKTNAPGLPLAAIAIGELALDKHDYALAAETFTKAAEDHPDDVRVLYGLSRAVASSDPDRSEQLLKQVLAQNPRHIPALLDQADRRIDAERYDDAVELLEIIQTINPHHPQALAFRAALAHLRNDPQSARDARTQALHGWDKNPEVDYLIGRELSQKYRFREGAASQRHALQFDPQYLDAQRQLAQDLLRLGNEEEGWALAESVFAADEYDVATFNLMELRDELAEFQTIEDESFIIRMTADEAAIYGNRVQSLLHEAKDHLCARYGLTLDRQITVEIFPNPDDFAVRTFGMPGIGGYLGVCFGNVITANSPASQQIDPSNWEAVLWHEFAHVVTLTLTRNRMPRWLSEGLSVYEEGRRDPRWGQRMRPAFRQMILDGELQPISEMSAAFLSPPSPLHMQLAYFQAGMAIEFLIDRFGFESVLAVLSSLADGLHINDALSRHFAPLEVLDREFAAFAKQRAEDYGAGVDWSPADLASALTEDDAGASVRRWVEQHPTNLSGLSAYADVLIETGQWEEAERVLQQTIELHPDAVGGDSAYRKLAEVYRQRGDRESERKALEQVVRLEADADRVLARLIELASEREDWQAVARYADELLAVNPLIRTPHAARVRAADQMGNPQEEIAGYRALLHMDPADPVEAHYQLADALFATGDADAAKQHVIRALEQAPRYRQAHRLLLAIVRGNETDDSARTSARPPSPPLPTTPKAGF